MKVVYIVYLIQFFLEYADLVSATSSPLREALFSIISNSVYIQQSPSGFLTNVTLNASGNTIRCGQECLKYETCLSANYYIDLQICSLFNEKSTNGQMFNITNPKCTLLTVINRKPASSVCILSSQATWSINSTTIFGNPDGSSGSSLSKLNYPAAMYYDKSNRTLLVGDQFNYRVLKFSLDNPLSNGIIVAGGNGYGCNLNQMIGVRGVALDSSHQMYVTDETCYRVLRFPPNSNSSTFGTIIANMTSPQGLFIDPLTDDIYVADSADNLVVKIISNSLVKVVIAGDNGLGSNLNQFGSANWVYFDSVHTNSLYVTDVDNHRILKFPANSNSATYGVIVAGNGSSGSASNQLNYPRGITLDENGNLYIADSVNGRIQRWLPNATSGETVVGGLWGTPAYISSHQVLFDENFNILALDIYNNRIQFFNLTVC